jgi:hypothetical protein
MLRFVAVPRKHVPFFRRKPLSYSCWSQADQRTDYSCRYNSAACNCYCCGKMLNYIEHGKICTRYCLRSDAGKLGTDLPSIISLPDRWSEEPTHLEALIELTLCGEQQEETESEKGPEKDGTIISVNKDESKERINDVEVSSDGKEDFSGLAKTVATTTVATTTVKTTPKTQRTTTESFGKTTRGLFVPEEASQQPTTTRTPIKKTSTVPFFFFPTESVVVSTTSRRGASSTTDWEESIAFVDDSRISFSDDDIRSAEGRPVPLVAATPPPPTKQGLQTSAALDDSQRSAETESAAVLMTPTERRQSRHFDGQAARTDETETHTRRSSRLYFMYD